MPPRPDYLAHDMPVTPLISTESVFAGIWSCDGHHAPAPSIEPSRIVMIPRADSPLARTGRGSSTVPPAAALVVEAGEALALRSVRGTAVQATVVAPADAAGQPRGGIGIRAMEPAALLAHHQLQRAARFGAPSLTLEELALELAAVVGRESFPTPRLPSSQRDAAHAALSMVAAAEATPSLAALARATGVAPWPLSRAIRAVLGIPLREYVLRRRIALALEYMVRTPSRTIGEAAHAAGFSSHAHFTDAVRARFGVPPRALLGHGRVDLQVKSAGATRAW
ncbi:MAG: hypothetical protein AMXMBFR55_08450 [Gemmatimonadota bacterium]